MEVNIDYSSLECDNPVSVNKNSVLLLARPFSVIYEYRGGEIMPKYYVDFGELSFTGKDIDKGKFLIVGQILEGERLGLLDNIFELDRFILFSYMNKSGNNEFVIYSKEHQESANWSEVLSFNELPPMIPIGKHADQLICGLIPSELDPELLIFHQMRGLLPLSVGPESNFILVYTEIKTIF